MSGHHASPSESRFPHPSSAPALRLIPGGQPHRETITADEAPAVNATQRPAMAVKIAMICKMLGVSPGTAEGTRLAMHHLRLRRLAVARSVTRPGHVAIQKRPSTPPMPFVYWEVFGQFGRVAPRLVGSIIRNAERTFGRVGSGRNDSRFIRRPVSIRRKGPGPAIELISNGRVTRKAA